MKGAPLGDTLCFPSQAYTSPCNCGITPVPISSILTWVRIPTQGCSLRSSNFGLPIIAAAPFVCSAALCNLFNRVLNFGDIRGIVQSDRHLVVQIDFPIGPDNPVSVRFTPSKYRLMRFANGVIASMMDSGCHCGGG